MSPEGGDNVKEKNQGNKGKSKPTPSEVIKELLQSPSVPEDIKKAVENVDFEGEYDVTKVATSVIKCLEPILSREIDLCSKSKDAFDRLVSGETGQHDDDANQPTEKPKDPSLLEFSLLALKTIANELPDLAELLLLKFKQPLIKCVVCDKLDNNVRNEASLICERIMEKTKFFEDEIDGAGSKWISVYVWIVKCAIRDDATRFVIKRVWAMHKLLTMYSMPDNSPVLELMKTTVTSTNFLLYKEGRQHIAHLLSLDKTRLASLNAKIKSALPSLVEKSKSLATSYGDIFNMAWTQALPDVRQELEDQVFQRWMELYLKLDRPKYLHQTQIGKAVFRILSHLHNSRRLLQLSSAITRLYQPIIWRALKSYHPMERCNAAELFLDVFPLEKPECNIVENSNLKEKQFKQIMDLLHDECHFTRIVAIRGLVPVFKRRVDCLSNNQCREILSWLANDLANDASSYLVRVAVWEFFSSLIQSENPIGFLTLLLPQMTNHFHDTNEQVRKAFVCMLLHIDASTDLNLSYTDVTPMSHIIARLSLEKETVGKLLAKLIMKTVYTEGMEVVEFVKRIKRLILKCPKAAENLFRWSSHILSAENANFVIVAILIYLRSYTKDRVEGRADGTGKSTCKLPQEASEQASKSDDGAQGVDDYSANVENISLVANQQLSASPSASPVKKKRKKSKRPSPEQPQQPDQGDDAKKEEKFDIDGPTAEIHAHLLGCAHVTWIVFSKQFESHPNISKDLNAVLTVCLQNYLRCYKGTPAWYASVTLASMVPVTKLSENTTASSSCLAELRRTELTTPKVHTEALIYTLTAWNRGFEIIELAIDYIDPAFRLFQLNSSAFLTVRSGNRKGRIVRFAKDGGKEMIGLTLLDILFYDYHNETRLILKQYDRIYELYHYLTSIKVVIEAKFSEGLNKESQGVLTDDFILKCFEIKLNLLTLLDRAESQEGSESPPFISTQHMCSLIDWTTKVILPQLDNVKVDETEENIEDEGSEEEDSEDEENRTTRKKSRKKKNEKKGPVKEDFVVSCLKAVLKRAIFMVKTKQTDKAHSHACANFALSLIKSDGKYWFIESCFDLVESLADHTRAWFPKDEDQILSTICPSLYSHMLLSVTTNTRLSQSLLRKYNCELSHLKRKLFTFPNILLALYGTTHNNFSKVFSSIIDYCISGIHSEANKIEVIDTVDKVEELSIGVCTITQAILSRSKLVPLMLPAISDFIHDNKEDGVRAVCGVSYLYTVVETYKQNFEKETVVQTVQNLYTIVSNLSSSDSNEEPDPEQSSQQDDDSFFLDPLAKLDIKKLGVEILQKIADSYDFQLVKPVLPKIVLTPSARRSNKQSLPRGI